MIFWLNIADILTCTSLYLIVILMFVNFPALSKVFKFADVEETGYVDVATISTLAVQLLGAQLSESEKETINSKAENKAEKGTGLF